MTSISENQQNLTPIRDSDIGLESSAGEISELDYHKNGNLADISPYSSTSSNSEGTLPSASSLNSTFPIARCNVAKAFSVFDSSSTCLNQEVFDPGCGSTTENVNYCSDEFALPDVDEDSLSPIVNMSPFLDLDNLGTSGAVQESSSEAPLKRIEDFVTKTMSVKAAARRNIRVMKSLKELNPETVRAMEEENERILQMETAGTSVSSPEIEILTIEVSPEEQPQPASRSLLKPPPPYAGPSTSSADIIDISPCGPSSGNDIIFVGSRDRYPSVSSFHCDDAENKTDENGKILINVGRMKREPCIYVADQLVPHLRPHQIGGIRFMFATLIESTAKFANTPGNGAVLAHSMGLGKTLQVITFLEAIFRCINVRSVLIVAPLNTMAHWMAEFNKWLPVEQRPERLKVVCIRDQKALTRNALIKAWAADGGVLLIGYEKLRAIVDRGNIGGKKRGKKRKVAEVDEIPPSPVNTQAATSSTNIPADNKIAADESDIEVAHLILEAGQIVICDEGHRIKSGDAAVTKVLKKVSTRRRIILTGYPLQNNLMEYWCMIDFVRPFLLGNEAEFANLFKNPIENGQCKDSNERDRKIMRQRTYILQRTLCRIVQRRDSRPLIAELPKKREFALIFKQTPSQANLYRSLYDELTKHRDTLNAVALYTTFRNITHHPAIFFAHLNKLMEASGASESAETGIGPICQLLVNLVHQGKWQRFLTNLNTFKFDEIHSGKMLFLKHLVEESVVKLKEKIIIFSQSIDVLDYLQEYLPMMLPGPADGQEQPFPQTFRIDGATASLERERLVNLFNDDTHRTQIFLISTEAGGIGINLTGGCRVVLMDVSWNPSKDIQAISRIYRYGQKNISSIYRLVGAGSMERCVFDRQTHKQFLFKRVVDDKSPILALNQADIGNLFQKETMCDPAEWHKCCEEPFPEEAKCDAVLQHLDSNAIFRQYLAEAPKIMDSILEADDTAQLSEYERREADASFLREKHPDNGGGSRRGGRNSHTPLLPAAGMQYRVPLASQAQQPARRMWPSVPSGQMAPPAFPMPHVVPHPEQVAIESVIRDAAVLAQLRQQAEETGQDGSKGDILERYARLQGVNCSTRRLVSDQPGGTPSLAYVLHSPGSPVNFLFKPDGTVWRIFNLAGVATMAAPPPATTSRTLTLDALASNGDGFSDLDLR